MFIKFSKKKIPASLGKNSSNVLYPLSSMKANIESTVFILLFKKEPKENSWKMYYQGLALFVRGLIISNILKTKGRNRVINMVPAG